MITSSFQRKKLSALCASLCLALSVSAGAQAEDTFALVQINQQALFFNQMNEGAQAAADAAGAKLVIFNANNDAAKTRSVFFSARDIHHCEAKFLRLRQAFKLFFAQTPKTCCD